jgi:rod shape-determining protein MreC
VRDFFKQPIVLALIAVTFLLLSAMIFSYATGSNNPVSNALGVVFTPLQKGATVIVNFISDKFSYFTEFDRLKAENAKLSEQVRENQADQSKLQELEDENARLKQYLGLKDSNPDYQLVMGQIVARDPGSYYTVFTLDKGSLHGIKVNDAVVTAEGLVGVVFEVGTSYCKVSTILEEGMPMGAIVTRTRDVAILEGNKALKTKNFPVPLLIFLVAC